MSQNVELNYRITTTGKQEAKDLAAAQREIRQETEKIVQPLQAAKAAADAVAAAMSNARKETERFNDTPAKPKQSAPGQTPAPSSAPHPAGAPSPSSAPSSSRAPLGYDPAALGREIGRIRELARQFNAEEESAAQRIARARQAVLGQYKGNTEAVKQLRAEFDKLLQAEQKHTALEQRKHKLAEYKASVAAVQALVERSQQSELTGLQRINAERQKALAEHGKTPALRNQINQVYDQEKSALVGQSVQNGISNPLQTAGDIVGGFAAKLGTAGIATAALAGTLVAGTAAAWSFVESQASIAEEMGNIALRTDLATEEVEQLAAAAKNADTDITSLETAARILATALDDPAGAGKKQTKAMNDLGIATTDYKGKALALGPVLKNVLLELSRIEDTGTRVAQAQILLGRSSRELLPLIANYEALRKAVASIGVGGNPELNKALDKADNQLDLLATKWQQFKKELAVPIANILVPLVFRPVNSLMDAVKEAMSKSAPTDLMTLLMSTANSYAKDQRKDQLGEELSALDAQKDRVEALQATRAKYETALKVASKEQLATIREGIAITDARISREQTLDQIAAKRKQTAEKLSNETKPRLGNTTDWAAQQVEDAASKASDKAVMDSGSKRAEAYRKRRLNTVAGITDEINTLEESIAKRNNTLSSKSLPDGADAANEERELRKEEAQKKHLEKRLKDISEYAEKRKSIDKELRGREAAADEPKLTSLERITAKHAEFVKSLKDQDATEKELARANAILPKELDNERRKQAVDYARQELALAEQRAAIFAQPGHEVDSIEATYERQKKLAQDLLDGQEKINALRDVEFSRAKALLDLFSKQNEERRKTAAEFATEGARDVSVVAVKQLERSADPLRVRTEDDEIATARAVSDERKRLIEEEYGINRKSMKESEATRIRDLALLAQRRDLVLQTADIEARREQKLASLKLEASRAQVERAAQLTMLTADPLDEQAAIDRVHALRMRAIEAEFKATGDRAEYARKLDQAEFERVQRGMELRRKQLDEFREGVGRLLSELESNGAKGFENFASAFVKQIRNTIITNLATMAFEGVRDHLPKIGGQTREQRDANGNPVLGPDGKPLREKTVLGKILTGTPFEDKGVDLKDATVSNTEATVANTNNLARLIALMELEHSKTTPRTREEIAKDLGVDTAGAATSRAQEEEQQRTKLALEASPDKLKRTIDPDDLAVQAKLISSAITPGVEAVSGNTVSTDANTAALNATTEMLRTLSTSAGAAALPGETESDDEGLPAATGALTQAAERLGNATSIQEDPSGRGKLGTASTVLGSAAGMLGKLAPQLAPLAALPVLLESVFRRTPSGVIMNATGGAGSAKPKPFESGSGETETEGAGIPGNPEGRNEGSGEGRSGGGGPLKGSVAGPLFDKNASKGERIGSGVATAGVIAAGTFGVISGVREGGGKGYTKAASSALATAAALDPEPISKSILAAGAAITGLVSSFLGPNKADKLKETDDQINAAKKAAEPYNLPGLEVTVASASGDEVSYDKFGRAREHKGSKPMIETYDKLTGFEHKDGYEDDVPVYTKSRRLSYSGRDPLRATDTSEFMPEESKSIWEKAWDVGKWTLPIYGGYRLAKKAMGSGDAPAGLPPEALAAAVPDFSDKGFTGGPMADPYTPDPLRAVAVGPRAGKPSEAEGLRAATPQVNVHYNIQQTVQAWDGADVMRASPRLADAIVKELQSTHRLRADILSIVGGNKH
jgi:hypothetical protein